MKIMQEEPDVPTVGHCEEQTMKVAIMKSFNSLEMKGHKKICAHLCEVLKHKIHL